MIIEAGSKIQINKENNNLQLVISNNAAKELIKELEYAIEESNDHMCSHPISVCMEKTDIYSGKLMTILIKPSKPI